MSSKSVARSLFLGLGWPAAAVVSLAAAVGGRAVTTLGLLLLATGTAAAYGLDRLMDRREEDAPLRQALFVATGCAALVAGILACTAAWRFTVCVALALLAITYVPVKRIVPKNVLTVSAWTAAVGTLPFAGAPELNGRFGAALLAVAFIMIANTVLCDVPDIADDRAAGVRGVAPRFGARFAAGWAGGAAVLGCLVSGASGQWSLTTTALSLVALAAVLGWNPQMNWPRTAADAVVTFLPGPLALILS